MESSQTLVSNCNGSYGSMLEQAEPPSYSVREGASKALTGLVTACRNLLPDGYLHHLQNIRFSVSSPSTLIKGSGSLTDTPVFPCPMKEQEAAAAIRALEGVAVAALADLRYGPSSRGINVDVCKIACYLMSSYMTTIDSLGKMDPEVKKKLPDTDLNEAQSVLYRRLSANLYETKIRGEYYHIHGSLDATTTLEMLGLKPFRPDLDSYSDCLDVIGSAVRNFTTAELETLNARHRQAGVAALTVAQFKETPHGQALNQLPPFTILPLETATLPVAFETAEHASSGQLLQGIRVLELCRVIAGPAIGRSLAALGASVLKVTSPYLPDVPFFQLDVNTGKHATSLHLRSPEHRAIFEALLENADVILDGYRPGALEALGYGPTKMAELAQRRGRGIVYVAEDCFGGSGLPTEGGTEWAGRPGWQQIADCVTGVAWEQGRFMGLEEPVVPPFPMSDYGTGALGCVAVLTGLYWRATKGGSWMGRTSLCQYDVFLLSLGPYPPEIQEWLRQTHDKEVFQLRHYDFVDEVGKRTLKSLRRVHPYLFESDMVQNAWSPGFGGTLVWPKGALAVDGLRIGYSRTARPNGYDQPTWMDWEVEPEVAQGE